MTIDRTVYLDGSDTTLQGNSMLFTVASTVTGVVLSRVKVPNLQTSAISVPSAATARLYAVDFDAAVGTTGGSLTVERSKLSTVSCSSGSVSVATSTLTALLASNCNVVARQNVINGGNVNVTGGPLTFENNVVTAPDCLQDLMDVSGLSGGSVIRFNTFVCTSTAASDGFALNCDSSASVTSNIFAYNSAHPMGPSGGFCHAQYSLFDTVASSTQTGGAGNVIDSASKFFVNAEAKDFHLASGSPAIGRAQPRLGLMDDLEGHARPNPAGSVPDIGAFEAP